MTAKSKNLLDLMRTEDRKKMLLRFKERTANKNINNKISSEMYMLAEFGLMFGWQAVIDVKNDTITGEEMFALLEAGRKVLANRQVEHGVSTSVAIGSQFSKHPNQEFEKGMRGFIEKGKV